MTESRIRKFLTKSLTIVTIVVIAAIDTILVAVKTETPYIIIISLIIALGIALFDFDDRIKKLDKKVETLKLNRRGVTQLIGVIILILVVLTLIAFISGTPNIATQLLGLNLTSP